MGNITLNPATLGHKNKLLFQFDTSNAATVGISMDTMLASGYMKYDVSGNTVYTKNTLTSNPGGRVFNVKAYQYTAGGAKSMSYLFMSGVSGLRVPVLDISSLVGLKSLTLTTLKSHSITYPSSDVSMTLFQLADVCVNHIDLSGLRGLGGNFVITYTPCRKLSLPTSSTPFSQFNIYDTSIEYIDASTLYGLGGSMLLNNNKILSDLIFPESSVKTTSISISNCPCVGNIDLSGMSKLGGSITIRPSSRRLTTVKFPSSDVSITSLDLANGSPNFSYLSGMIDLSGLTALGGYIAMQGNASINSVINPVSSQPVTEYNVNTCDISGTLDLSGFSNLGGNINFSYNSRLSQVINPAFSDRQITGYRCNNTNLQGTLDLTGFSRLGGVVEMDNTKINYLLLPSEVSGLTYITGSNCRLMGSLDLSSIKSISSYITFSTNPSVNGVILPSTDVSAYSVNMSSCSIEGNVDLSAFKSITDINFFNNKVSSVTFPKQTSKLRSAINFSNNRLSGTFDISCFNNVYLLSIASNPSINKVIFPPNSSCNNTQFVMHSCNLTGVLDLSSNDSIQYLYAYNNPNLTGIIGINRTNNPNLMLIQAHSCNLTGTLDLSTIRLLAGTLDLYNNRNLTNIIFPDVSGALQSFDAINFRDCCINTPLDFRGFAPFFAKNFTCYNNPSIGYMLFPNMQQGYVQTFYAFNSGLSGVLDISGLTLGASPQLTTAFRIYNNPKLTGLLMRDSSGVINSFHAFDCDLTGNLEIPLSGLRYYVRLYNNRKLTNVTFKYPISNQILELHIHDCSLNGTLDLSNIKALGGSNITDSNGTLYLYNNSNLTNVVFSSSSGFIHAFNIENCNLSGTLDISGLIGLGSAYYGGGSSFTVRNNKNLQNILFPSSGVPIMTIDCSGCNLTGTLDMSMLKGAGRSVYYNSIGSINLSNNPNLTNVLLDCSGGFHLYIENCNLSGTLDLRNVRNLGGPAGSTSLVTYVSLRNNPSLNTILFPESSGYIISLNVENCGLQGVLDVSGLKNLGTSANGVLNFNGNKALQGIMLPDVSLRATEIRAYDCSLKQEYVDHILRSAAYAVTPPNRVYVNKGGSDEPSAGHDNPYLKIIRQRRADALCFINVKKTPVVAFPLDQSKTNSGAAFYITSHDQNFDIDTTNGQGLIRGGVSNISYATPYDTSVMFSIYDGSALYGVNSVKAINTSNLGFKQFDASSLTKMEQLTLTYTPSLTSITLPDTSSLTYVNIGDVSIVSLDLRPLKSNSSIEVTISRSSKVTSILFPDSSASAYYTIGVCSSINIVDMSSNIGMNRLWIYSCPNLETLRLPNTFYWPIGSTFQISDTSILTLDISNGNITNTTFNVTSNPRLTSILFPDSSFSHINVIMNDLRNVDMSRLVTLDTNRYVSLQGNRNLTSIKNPRGSLSTYSVRDCSLSGALDVSGFSSITGTFDIGNNYGITSILLPDISFGNLSKFMADGCSLNVQTIDEILRRLNIRVLETLPPYDLSLYLNGGSNASPTGGSANTDLLNLIDRFAMASKVLDYKIN